MVAIKARWGCAAQHPPAGRGSTRPQIVCLTLHSGTGKQYGDVLKDVVAGASYSEGDTVSVTFVSACPRNNLRTGGTFLTVERFTADAAWAVVRPRT